MWHNIKLKNGNICYVTFQKIEPLLFLDLMIIVSVN